MAPTAAATLAVPDGRHLRNGRQIPSERYSDQPYVVRTDDGAWLCILTTGSGHEGATGQHVVSHRSLDQGRTWTESAELEPASGPEASYAVPLKVAGGRVYVFYNHNTDNLRAVRADDPPYPGGWCARVDSLGHFVFKYSDDHGRTWSERRFVVPVRETAIDRANPYGGRVRFFWNVGKPLVHAGAAYVPLHKVGGFGDGFFTRSEGWLLRSDNLSVEQDPAKIRWETLPEGEVGLCAPAGGGRIAEEQSIVTLGDGTFYAVWRTVDGHPATARSRNGGRTWTPSAYLQFADGRRIKHPRAANFVWAAGGGRYLYWFHNHGGRGYSDRNPVWIAGGIERDTAEGRTIAWSEPEILLYDDDAFVRMSYPDLIQEDGRWFVTETQKELARVHEVDGTLLAGLWAQFGEPLVTRAGLLQEWKKSSATPDEVAVELPALPAFLVSDEAAADLGTLDRRAGLSLELWLEVTGPVEGGRVLASNRTADGRGFSLRTTKTQGVELIVGDGRVENRWRSDAGILAAAGRHHLVTTIDGGPKTITFVADGRLLDGGAERQFGWGRFSPHLRELNGQKTLTLATAGAVRVREARVFSRALRTSEAVLNYRAGSLN
ncbi:MAG: sialidase family protein [Lacunisphaera sp.]|nr:sialidase family protein [Lacunisphaera sp.]